MTEVRTGPRVHRLLFLSIFSLPAGMAAFPLNLYLSSLLTDKQLWVLLPFCSTKKDLKALHFQRQPPLFGMFSWSPEWESSDIMIPLVHVHAIPHFFFSNVQDSLFLGYYLMISSITQLLHNLTLRNITCFLPQAVVSSASSFQFPDFVNFY